MQIKETNMWRVFSNNKRKMLSMIAPVYNSKRMYKKNFGKELNLKCPKDFNEKLQWLKIKKYSRNPLVIQCADKVRVREYIRKCGCEELLIECLGVYKNAHEIPWENLPEQFVLKCNHGAGYNIVCSQKNQLNIKDVEKQLQKWLKKDYSLEFAETHYHYIKPHLIICESYLQPSYGLLPDDYKVYCFNGRAEAIMVCKEREREKCKYYYFDREWNFRRYDLSTYNEEAVTIEKPLHLQELLKYAEIISQAFPFVRIDFYVMDGKIYFGEMTFTPCGCLDEDLTEEGNKFLSSKLQLPK